MSQPNDLRCSTYNSRPLTSVRGIATAYGSPAHLIPLAKSAAPEIHGGMRRKQIEESCVYWNLSDFASSITFDEVGRVTSLFRIPSSLRSAPPNQDRHLSRVQGNPDKPGALWSHRRSSPPRVPDR